jgi:TfoX/Sxy family transcriptional regulator of competence genes
MAYDSALADRVTDLLTARRVSFETKSMMGGLCFMVDGKMCVGVEKSRLMVRLDPAVEGEALKQRGCRPMDFTGRPMKGVCLRPP